MKKMLLEKIVSFVIFLLFVISVYIHLFLLIFLFLFLVFQTYGGLQETLGGQWRTHLEQALEETLGAGFGGDTWSRSRRHRTQDTEN